MSFFDDEMYVAPQDDSNNVDSANLNQFDNDVAEVVQMALGDNASQAWAQSAAQAYSEYRNAAESQRMYEPPRAEGDKAPTTKQGAAGGILGRITDFVDKNKSLSEMLIKGVAGAAAGNQAKKTAQLQSQSRLDELKLKNKQEREKDAQVSASVSGLRAPTGIVGRAQQQLRRSDGTPVYQNGRIV